MRCRWLFGAMARSRIVLETGVHSPWVSRLSELGHEVIVAHARKVRVGRRSIRGSASGLNPHTRVVMGYRCGAAVIRE
jgi:transposase